MPWKGKKKNYILHILPAIAELKYPFLGEECYLYNFTIKHLNKLDRIKQ